MLPAGLKERCVCREEKGLSLLPEGKAATARPNTRRAAGCALPSLLMSWAPGRGMLAFCPVSPGGESETPRSPRAWPRVCRQGETRLPEIPEK